MSQKTWDVSRSCSIVRMALSPAVSMCIISDGMDQAKFRTPRTRKPKTKIFETMHRPCLHVSATWGHGYGLNLAIGDEDLKKNSETTIEQVSKLMDDILSTCKHLPAGVNLQCDNTYREAKNQYVCAFAILSVALGCFRFFTCSFLRKGHSNPSTKKDIKSNVFFYSFAVGCVRFGEVCRLLESNSGHEDIDQYFSQVAAFLTPHDFSSPDDVVNILDSSSRPDSLSELHRKQAQQTKVRTHAFKLDEVARWQEWVSALGIRLKGLRNSFYDTTLLSWIVLPVSPGLQNFSWAEARKNLRCSPGVFEAHSNCFPKRI